MTKVSVLMPVYNAEAYVREAIQSIINQTYLNWELLILDDGSRDGSVSVVKNFNDPRIRLIQNEQNEGLIFTLNRGLSEATGELIARLDADDEALSLRLEAQVAEFAGRPELMLVGGQAELFGAVTGPKRVSTKETDVQASIPFENPFIHSAVMFRPCHLDGTPVRYDKSYPHAEDYALWSEMLWRGGRAFNLESTLVRYRIHEKSVSHVYRDDQAVTALKIRLEHFAKLGLYLAPAEQERFLALYTEKRARVERIWLRALLQRLLANLPPLSAPARRHLAAFVYGLWPAAASDKERLAILFDLFRVSPRIGLWMLQSKISRLAQKK